jgi:hypothetical protein
VEQAIVCARPEHSFFQRRLGKGKNRVVILDASDVVLNRAAARLLFAFVVPREVFADRRPGVTLIGGFENSLTGGVNRVRIV